ncbi:MAG TPA: class I SAM-dependent methyltransferase [Candidatus Angelobacter sp.]|nr:class I SAM-dependent methyltransferase [Candidatus Angelobacter sp.]
MAIDEKSLWNRKYSEGSHRSLDPDPLLVSAYSELLSDNKPGFALDIAGGVGRHAVWLAQRGWRVKLIDVSDVGIEIAKRNAALALAGSGKEGLITAATADLNSLPDLGRGQYDLVLVFYYLQRELFPALISALKPGGFLIYKTYTTEQKRFGSSGPSHPMFLLEPNELLRAFNSLRVLHYRETVREKGLAELVAMK